MNLLAVPCHDASLGFVSAMEDAEDTLVVVSQEAPGLHPIHKLHRRGRGRWQWRRRENVVRSGTFLVGLRPTKAKLS